MNKQTFLSRFLHIVTRLEKGPATFEAISSYLERMSETSDQPFRITQRTFQRDIRDINTQMGIEIVNERKGERRYYIRTKSEFNFNTSRLIESYRLSEVLRAAREHTEVVIMESRSPNGLEHFTGLLYAARNKLVIRFTYTKFWQEEPTHRTVHPVAIKESQGRWYLLAVDTIDRKLKTFGTDRISDLDVTTQKYREIYDFDIASLFRSYFGIIRNSSEKVKTIELCFTRQQGLYVQNYPLHHSQEVIDSSKDEITFRLRLILTTDFVQELLSFGSDLEVLRPTTLRNTIKNILQKTLTHYPT